MDDKIRTYYFDEMPEVDSFDGKELQKAFFEWMAKDILDYWLGIIKACDDEFAKRLPDNIPYIDRIIKLISDNQSSNEYEFDVRFAVQDSKNLETSYLGGFTICFDADRIYNSYEEAIGYKVYNIFSTGKCKESCKDDAPNDASEECSEDSENKADDNLKSENRYEEVLEKYGGEIEKVETKEICKALTDDRLRDIYYYIKSKYPEAKFKRIDRMHNGTINEIGLGIHFGDW